MRKPIIWATSLVVAIVAGFLVSCDSKGSAPTSSNNNNGGGNTTSYLLSVLSPLALDTSVPNGTTLVTVTGKVLPAQTGLLVIASFNGTTDTVTTNGGVFSIPVTGLPIGQTTVKLKLGVDTTQSAKILLLRQIGAPQLVPVVPVGALPTATSFTDSAVIQLNSPNNSGDTIWYTTNGASSAITSSDPKVISGTKKTLNGTTTIKAIAIEHTSYGILTSDTTTVTYSINQKEGTPYFNVSRYDSSSVPVKINITGVGAADTIRYTTTGGDPNSNSPIYKDSILVTDSTTIIAKAFSGLNVPSPACTTTVKLIALPPVFSDTVAQKTSQVYLKLTTPSSTSALPVPVYYTLDGSTPTIQSLKYNDSILLNGNVTIKAIAALPYWRPSAIVSHSYTFQVATPLLSSSTGHYDTTQLLTLTDSAKGASIHYTLDGSTPTCSSPVYNPASSLRLDSTVVVNARACITGWDSSNVATGSDTFKIGNINFTPDSGVYRSYQTVTMSTRSPGVTYYVTRDSSDPTWNANGPTGTTQKKNPGDTLWITKDQWVRAQAVRSGWISSSIQNRRYIVEGDTLLVGDFSQSSLTNPIGTNWHFWACEQCVNTGITDQISGNADTTNWNPAIGYHYGKIDFSIPATGATRGPGYAGLSVDVPDSLMGTTYRIAFWAKWVPGTGAPSSVPLVTEMVWTNNNNYNGGYEDGFQRNVGSVGTTWKHYVMDYADFYPAGNAYLTPPVTDSTNTTPKSYSIVGFPMAAAMNALGLDKFQGWVGHASTWTPEWVWGADHDNWKKPNISAFRWSVIQPFASDSIAATISNNDPFCPNGAPDCHDPNEPGFDHTTLMPNVNGELQIDRVQLISKPQ